MCLEFPQFGFDVLSRFYLASLLIMLVSHTDGCNSPRLGREAQEREPRETAQHPKRQFSQAPKAHSGLGWVCDVIMRGVNNCFDTIRWHGCSGLEVLGENQESAFVVPSTLVCEVNIRMAEHMTINNSFLSLFHVLFPRFDCCKATVASIPL